MYYFRVTLLLLDNAVQTFLINLHLKLNYNAVKMLQTLKLYTIFTVIAYIIQVSFFFNATVE